MSAFYEMIQVYENEYENDIVLSCFALAYKKYPQCLYINAWKELTPSVKFDILKTNIFDSKFQGIDVYKNKMFFLFYRAQKLYHTFSRFAYLYKYKKAAQYDNNYDLCYNDLDTLGENLKITLLENNTKYTFRISDLLKIIISCLSNAPDLFLEIKDICNPHTNMKISTANLYNIYFATLNSPCIASNLFDGFFRCNFDIGLFSANYECVLRNIGINSYYQDLDEELALEFIDLMLKDYESVAPVICDGYPTDKVLHHLGGLLKDYLYTSYSYGPLIRQESHQRLIVKFHDLKKNVPLFGRIIVRAERPRVVFEPQKIHEGLFVFGQARNQRISTEMESEIGSIDNYVKQIVIEAVENVMNKYGHTSNPFLSNLMVQENVVLPSSTEENPS